MTENINREWLAQKLMQSTLLTSGSGSGGGGDDRGGMYGAVKYAMFAQLDKRLRRLNMWMLLCACVEVVIIVAHDYVCFREIAPPTSLVPFSLLSSTASAPSSPTSSSSSIAAFFLSSLMSSSSSPPSSSSPMSWSTSLLQMDLWQCHAPAHTHLPRVAFVDSLSSWFALAQTLAHIALLCLFVVFAVCQVMLGQHITVVSDTLYDRHNVAGTVRWLVVESVVLAVPALLLLRQPTTTSSSTTATPTATEFANGAITSDRDISFEVAIMLLLCGRCHLLIRFARDTWSDVFALRHQLEDDVRATTRNGGVTTLGGKIHVSNAVVFKTTFTSYPARCILAASTAVVLFFSFGLHLLERRHVDTLSGAASPFATFGSCVYFTLVTATTLGYGDVTPTLLLSQVWAIVICLFGLVLTSLGVGAITNFLSPSPTDEYAALWHRRHRLNAERQRLAAKLIQCVWRVNARRSARRRRRRGDTVHVGDNGSNTKLATVWSSPDVVAARHAFREAMLAYDSAHTLLSVTTTLPSTDSDDDDDAAGSDARMTAIIERVLAAQRNWDREHDRDRDRRCACTCQHNDKEVQSLKTSVQKLRLQIHRLVQTYEDTAAAAAEDVTSQSCEYRTTSRESPAPSLSSLTSPIVTPLPGKHIHATQQRGNKFYN